MFTIRPAQGEGHISASPLKPQMAIASNSRFIRAAPPRRRRCFLARDLHKQMRQLSATGLLSPRDSTRAGANTHAGNYGLHMHMRVLRPPCAALERIACAQSFFYVTALDSARAGSRGHVWLVVHYACALRGAELGLRPLCSKRLLQTRLAVNTDSANLGRSWKGSRCNASVPPPLCLLSSRKGFSLQKRTTQPSFVAHIFPAPSPERGRSQEYLAHSEKDWHIGATEWPPQRRTRQRKRAKLKIPIL